MAKISITSNKFSNYIYIMAKEGGEADTYGK
jgi:hypothetical protein